tara:strand:- start:4247 stop:4549 length:303 start_codon:yes stop_codon:yes gene_type:complete
MKIKKNGKVVNLTESEIKEIVKQHKIKRFLSEDRESRKSEDKKIKIKSIINKITELTNILKTTDTNSESLQTLHQLEMAIEKEIERLEDRINKKEIKKES